MLTGIGYGQIRGMHKVIGALVVIEIIIHTVTYTLYVSFWFQTIRRSKMLV